jgi:hypothetical protein
MKLGDMIALIILGTLMGFFGAVGIIYLFPRPNCPLEQPCVSRR